MLQPVAVACSGAVIVVSQFIDVVVVGGNADEQGISPRLSVNTACYILARIEPFRLRIYFACDVDRLETVKCLVESFLALQRLQTVAFA